MVTTEKPASPLTVAVSKQREAKDRFDFLIKAMKQIAEKLAETDPETAGNIAIAAAKAEDAQIGRDMDEVIRLLQSELVVPADATQGNVIKQLRIVLDIIRGAGDNLEARLLKMEQMRAAMDALKDLVRRQKLLERQSRILSNSAAESNRVADAVAQVAALAKRQRENLGELERAEFNQAVLRLAVGRRALGTLGQRLAGLVREMSDPYPSPDKMAGNIATNRAVATEATTVRIELKTLINDSEMRQAIEAGKASDQADALLAALAKLGDELLKAATALEKDNLKEAQLADAEARAHWKDAVAALDRLVERVGGALPLARLSESQRAILEAGNALSELVRELTVAEEAAEVVSPKRTAWNQSIRSAPHIDLARTAREAEKDSPLDAAVAALLNFDKPAAIAHQQRVLSGCEEWRRQLQGVLAYIESLLKQPDYPRQQDEQAKIAADIGLLAKGYVPGQEQTRPPIPFLANELEVQVSRAAERAVSAAGWLQNAKPSEANVDQKEVLRLLDAVAMQLQSDINAYDPGLTDELMATCLAKLERIVVVQKGCNADTITVWDRRNKDGTLGRGEQIKTLTIGKIEGQVVELFDELKDSMAKAVRAHSLVTFPPTYWMTIDIVQGDVGRIRKRLDEKDPGPKTQQMQAEVLERLDNLLAAMKPKVGELQKAIQWSQHAWLSVEDSATDRAAEIQMLIMIQRMIKRRTEELREMRASGKAPADVDLAAEFALLRRQQAEVTASVREMLDKDRMVEYGKPR